MGFVHNVCSTRPTRRRECERSMTTDNEVKCVRSSLCRQPGDQRVGRRRSTRVRRSPTETPGGGVLPALAGPANTVTRYLYIVDCSRSTRSHSGESGVRYCPSASSPWRRPLTTESISTTSLVVRIRTVIACTVAQGFFRAIVVRVVCRGQTPRIDNQTI